MTGLHWFVGAIGVGALLLPAWKSVLCLIRARRLLRWRRPSLEGLDDQPAALRGEVRVGDPLHTPAIGDCLWHRQVTQVHTVSSKSASTKTVSDISDKAVFSIVIEGLDFIVKDLPTRVYGAHYRRTHGGNRSFMSYWLPVVGYLTVLGKVRQKGSRWEIVKDPKLGLIYSIHAPERTAMRELVKAGLGLAVVAVGLMALYFFMLADIR